MENAARTGDAPDISSKLPEIWPELRAKSITGWGLIALIVTVAMMLFWIASGLEREGSLKLIIIALVAGAFAIGGVFALVRRQHEALIMPYLSRTAGLDFQKAAADFARNLPTRLLPKASVRKGQDWLSGRIAERHVQFAEVHFETGGKNSRTLFKGVVMEFQNVTQMPAFFVASEAKTKGWFIFGGDIRVDDLVQVRTINGRTGTVYGVWSSSREAAEKPGVDAVLQVLTGLETLFGHEAALYTASCDGKVTHVAISHPRDMFRIGGLLAAKDDVLGQIGHAYYDLTLPLKLAKALYDAETVVAKAAG